MFESAAKMAQATRIGEQIVAFLPNLAGAIALVAIGWLLARLVRGLVNRFTGLTAPALRRVGLGDLAERTAVPGPMSRFVGELLYWLVILLFLAMAASVLGLAMFAGWLDQIVTYLPNIVSGALIIFAGVVLARIAREATIATTLAIGETQRMALARAAQAGTLGLLIIVGLDQIGIDITAVLTVLAVVIAAMFGGLALAFGLGARGLVSNLIGARYLASIYRKDERVRIGELEGTILELTETGVVLDTHEGRLTVPAHIFSEQASLLVGSSSPNA